MELRCYEQSSELGRDDSTSVYMAFDHTNVDDQVLLALEAVVPDPPRRLACLVTESGP